MSSHNAPYPCSERAIYGFVLYIGTFVIFGIYVTWVALPDSWLEAVGFNYFPQRYWLFALPIYLISIPFFIMIFYIARTNMRIPPFDSISTVTDSYAKDKPIDNTTNRDSIPPLYDISFLTITKKICNYDNSKDNTTKIVGKEE